LWFDQIVQRDVPRERWQVRDGHLRRWEEWEGHRVRDLHLAPCDQREKELVEAIARQPAQTGPYLHLAESFRRRAHLDDAARLLTQGLRACKNDPALRRTLDKVQLARLERVIEILNRRMVEEPWNRGTAKKIELLTKMLSDMRERSGPPESDERLP
jgi:hypothetical protein